MDLGFGNGNQQVGNATAQALLATAQAQEAALNDEIAKYDGVINNNNNNNNTNDDDEDAVLQQLRAKRLKELKQAAVQRQQWKAAGHGEYTELCASSSQQDSRDVAHAFFQAAKQSERLVLHFYRDSTRYCQVFHKHLAEIAPQHLETKFCKVNVQDCDSAGGAAASFLVERLGITVMPTLLLVKNRKAIHQIRGFDEIIGADGGDNFTNAQLVHTLAQYEMVTESESEQQQNCSRLQESSNSQKHRSATGVNSIHMSRRSNNNNNRRMYDDNDDEHEEY